MQGKRTRIADDFVVSSQIMELARERGWSDPTKEIDRFKDYHKAHGSLMADWESAFRFWLSSPVTQQRTAPMVSQAKQGVPAKPEEKRPEDVSKVRSLVLDLADKFDARKKA